MGSKAERLAIQGGTPVNEQPFPAWSQFDLGVQFPLGLGDVLRIETPDLVHRK